MQYARAIVDAEPGQVPGWSWGSVVLAATYRGLCQACLKTERTAVITGCPLLLQLWSYERFAIARPLISEEPYLPEMYGMWDEDSPTMCSLWTDRRVSSFKLFNLLFYVSVYEEYRCSCVILQMSWAHRQVRKTYPQFVSEFDRMRPQDVIWTPYTAAAIQTRAPHRLSSLCTRDEEYWLTKANLVFDILVEPYCVERVMRQFGRRQHFPLLPRAFQAVSRNVHE
jgi:hypothetical protein